MLSETVTILVYIPRDARSDSESERRLLWQVFRLFFYPHQKNAEIFPYIMSKIVPST
jgi:hypothetical protein